MTVLKVRMQRGKHNKATPISKAMRVGLVTVGQSPREDLVPAIVASLPKTVAIVEIGALDGISRVEIEVNHHPASSDRKFFTRLADGKEVWVEKYFIHDQLQKSIRSLEREVDLIGLLCSGSFPDLHSKAPLLLPNQLLEGYVKAYRTSGNWGLLLPSVESLNVALGDFKQWGIRAVGVKFLPHSDPGNLDEVVSVLAREGVSVYLLNCFSYTLEMKRSVKKISEKPVISVGSIFTRALAELVS